MQTHVNCSIIRCQAIPTKSGDLNCSASDKCQTIRKRPAIIDKTNLTPLIVVPSGLVSLWEKESLKIICNRVLRIWNAHSEKYEIFIDLYLSLESGTRNDYCLNNIVFLTFTKSLNSIMRKNTYYRYAPERPGQRKPKKIWKIWVARLLVYKAHDINNLVLKNLVTLAGERASIWFITGTPLSNGVEKFAGFLKYWDATTIVKQLREPLNPNLIREIGIYYNKAFSSKITMDADKKDINDFIDLTNHCMELKAQEITEIMLILGIQQRGDTKFRGDKFLNFLP